jgi:hypothetical protein
MSSPHVHRLVWCAGCDAYTHDTDTHSCAEQEARREHLRARGETFPARLSVKRERSLEYTRYVREQARLRRERRAS